MLPFRHKNRLDPLAVCARNFLFYIIFSVIGIGLSGAVEPPSSIPSLKQLSLEQLADLEVTSVARKEQKIADTAAAIYVITQEEIHRSGVTTIPEALRLAPGVTVSRADGNGADPSRLTGGSWGIGVRGFGFDLSRSVLVLIDGHSVYTPIFADVFWEAQDPLLEDIDRIEVIRGPGGQWGGGTESQQGVYTKVTWRW
jgi:iron complex outermembrane receptor protein